MRISRIFHAAPLEVGGEVSLGKKHAHYLSHVLRLPEDAEVIVFNGDGNDYRCRVVGLARNSATVSVIACNANGMESPLKITLSQAMSRGARMDYSLQKATELGVHCVRLLVSERVELKLSGERLARRMSHWRGVLVAASEQSGRARVPELRAPISLGEWAALPGTRVALNADADLSLQEVEPGQGIDVAVGPEGGFSPAELQLMAGEGALLVRLGPRVLRTETAGPAAIAVMQALSGDFS